MPYADLLEVCRSLQPGDQIEATHEVKVGFRTWSCTTRGTLIQLDRRHHGLHFLRAVDEPASSDILVLRRANDERTTIALDEFTQVRVCSPRPDAHQMEIS